MPFINGLTVSTSHRRCYIRSARAKVLLMSQVMRVFVIWTLTGKCYRVHTVQQQAKEPKPIPEAEWRCNSNVYINLD